MRMRAPRAHATTEAEFRRAADRGFPELFDIGPYTHATEPELAYLTTA